MKLLDEDQNRLIKMIYQDIIICPDIFEKIKISLSDAESEDIDLRAYRENLRLKSLLLDNSDDGIEQRINKIIENSNYFAKKKLLSILSEFKKSRRLTYYSIKNNTSQLSEIISILSNKSNSQLINTDDPTICALKFKNDELDILSFDELIDPPNLSRCFAKTRDIRLKKGDIFDPYKQLKFYWDNTESLHICDDYLRQKETQFPVLAHIIKSIPRLKNLSITSSFSDSSQQDKDSYYSKDEFMLKIENLTGIKPILIDKKAGERHYYTDYFDIDMRKGIDFFNKYKLKKDIFEVFREIVTISVTPNEKLQKYINPRGDILK